MDEKILEAKLMNVESFWKRMEHSKDEVYTEHYLEPKSTKFSQNWRNEENREREFVKDIDDTFVLVTNRKI